MFAPVENGWISKSHGLFGCRRRPGAEPDPRCAAGEKWHAGIDIGKPEGTPVYAVDDGVIDFASNVNGVRGFGGFGKVIVQKVGRWYVLYSHLATVFVQSGQRVRAGQVIGKVGRTRGSVSQPGRMFDTSGPHLHFEVSERRYPKAYGEGNTDPLEWLLLGGMNIREHRSGYRISHGELAPFTVNDEDAPAWELGDFPVPNGVPTSFQQFIGETMAYYAAPAVARAMEGAQEYVRERAAEAQRIALQTLMDQSMVVFTVNAAAVGAIRKACLAGNCPSEETLQAVQEYTEASTQAVTRFWAAVAAGDLSNASQAILDAGTNSIQVWNIFRGLHRDLVLTTIREINDALAGLLGQIGIEIFRNLYTLSPMGGAKPQAPGMGAMAAIALFGLAGIGVYAFASAKGKG